MSLLTGSQQSAGNVSLISLPDADHLLTNADDIAFVSAVVAAFIQRRCHTS